MIRSYKLSDEELSQLDDLRLTYSGGDLWALDDTALVRKRIKNHYIKEQDHTCCYCSRKILTSNHRLWDLDHIVPRITHPNFCFEPKNIAASCPDCNTIKSQSETLVNIRRKKFPDKSLDYKIIHPHFDKYTDHIAKLHLIYIAKTAKGQKTIEMCGLLRFTVNFVKWDVDPTDNRFEAELSAILTGSRDNAQEALHTLSKIFHN